MNVNPSDRQRDTHTGLLVKLPVRERRKERHSRDEASYQPNQATSNNAGLVFEVDLTEGELKHDESVDCDEADD